MTGSGFKHIGRHDPVPLGMVLTGPLIEVVLSGHLATGLSASESVVAKLMVDTGAQRTVVQDQIPQSLNLIPIDFALLVGVSQKPEECPVYRMNIDMLMGNGVNTMQVRFTADIVGVASPRLPTPHLGLLGRDFLRYVRLTYDGPDGFFEIHHVGPPPPGIPAEDK